MPVRDLRRKAERERQCRKHCYFTGRRSGLEAIRPRWTLVLSNREGFLASPIRRRGDVLARVPIMVEFARTPLLRRRRALALMRCLLPIVFFMAYGCACAEVGNSGHHLDSRAKTSAVQATAVFGFADYSNRAEHCHHDLPVGSTSSAQGDAGLSSQRAASVSHPLPATGWVSSLTSGQRAPPGGLSPANHLVVRPTGATALAVLCVFRS